MANNVEFNIRVTMDERWVDHFCSMLKYMEHCGNIGHTTNVAFCTDGDGDFRPKFEIDREFEIKNGYRRNPDIEVVYDAG